MLNSLTVTISEDNNHKVPDTSQLCKNNHSLKNESREEGDSKIAKNFLNQLLVHLALVQKVTLQSLSFIYAVTFCLKENDNFNMSK